MSNIFTAEITKKNFINFVWPSVLMMVFIAIYYGMDSVLVANMMGEGPLAALSIAYPIQGIQWGMTIMMASGSSAIVAIKMGEGKMQEANEKFTGITVLSAIMGVLLMVFMLVFMDPMVNFLGATPDLEGYVREFLIIIAFGCPWAFVSIMAEYYIRVDGHPGYALFLYIVGGIVHLVAAIILMGPCDMGLRGTAWANVAGLIASTVAGGAYFVIYKTNLKFIKFKYDWRFVGHCFANGSSEMVTESAAGITTFFFNMLTLKMAGETGVAAISVVLNIHYLCISVFLGYVMGVAPLISYFYGAKAYEKVNQVIRYSRNFILAFSVIAAILVLTVGHFIVMVYERPGTELYEMCTTGVRFLCIPLLLGGINVFASGFFTAYGNGVISAIISACRALIFIIIGMYLLSWLLGMTGIWLTLTFAEVITLGVTFGMFRKYKDVYHYKIF